MWAPDDLAVLSHALDPDGWLGHITRPDLCDRLSLLSSGRNRDLRELSEARDITDLELARALVGIDTRSIAHAVSLLISADDRVCRDHWPVGLLDAVAEDRPTLDHVGVEVFGRLEWYQEMLCSIGADLGLGVRRMPIFSSVQVREGLARVAEVGEVRIARVFFSRPDPADSTAAGAPQPEVNVELLEVAQPWQLTAERQWGMFAHLPGREERLKAEGFGSGASLPVGHLALRVSDR